MTACYILFSDTLQKFYIGATHEDVIVRSEKHKNKTYGNNRFTALANDWELFLLIEADDYAHAIRIERKIKSMKSSKYCTNLKQYPELQEKLVSSTRLSR